MTSTRAAAGSRPKSTTRRDLHRLRGALLGLTVAVAVASLTAFTGVQRTVREVAARTAPAVLEVAATRSALVQADSAAMRSFQTGEGRLIGPGEQYQSQLAIANQDLAQVAEHNSAGVEGSRTLQLVEGLLTAYGGLMEEADAHFRSGGPTRLSATDLWYASRLMHEDSGILAQLDALARLERGALEETLISGWMNPADILLWAVPIVLLLAMLGLAQVFGKRRFRRTVNPALAAATALVVLVACATATLLVSRSHAEAAGQAVSRVAGRQSAQADRVAIAGQQALAQVLRDRCSESGQAGCGDTVQGFLDGVAQSAPLAGQTVLAQRDLAGDKEVSAELAAANLGGVLEYFIAIGALVIAALVVLGLRGGIDEYRYRHDEHT